MRLDNLRPFDGTDRNKNKVPKKIMKEVMQHPKVKPYVISQFPAVNSQWVKVIVKPLFVAGAAVLVVVAAVNIFTGSVDDVVVWAVLAAAINY